MIGVIGYFKSFSTEKICFCMYSWFMKALQISKLIRLSWQIAATVDRKWSRLDKDLDW